MSNSTLTRTLDFEALEDRLLFSASPVDVPENADAGDHGSSDHPAQESTAQTNTAEATGEVDASAVTAANTAATADASNDSAPASEVTTDSGEAVTPDVATPVNLPRHELIVLDLRVENAEAVAENLMAQAPEDVKFEVVYLDKAANGLDQIQQTLSQLGSGDERFDAIHLITHADSGRVFMGSTPLTTAALTSDAAVQSALTEWKSYLAEDADVLFYGCDLAEGPAGQAFVNQFAELTGADVAASTDTTGSAAGANWTFEMKSGLIEASTLTSTLLAELSADPADPVVTVDVVPGGAVDADTSVMINENFQFTVTFENRGGAGETDGTGYAPFVDVSIAMGIDLNSVTPTYLGEPVQLAGNLATLITPGVAGVGAGYDNSTGLTDVTFIHPYTGQIITVAAGTEHYIYDLPFGSFVPNQQPVSLLFTAHTDRGELNLNGIPLTTLPVTATGGFRFGTDPLNNPLVDPAIVGASSTGHITPVVWEVSKDLLEHENETATGPNFPNTWALFVDVANTETLTDITLTDTLPAHVIYKPGTLAINDVPQAFTVGVPFMVGGITYTVTQEPAGGTTHGGQLVITISQVTGSVGSDVKITYQTYTPQFDASNADILPDNTGNFNYSTNSVSATGSWRPDGTGVGDPAVPVSDVDTGLGDQGVVNHDTLEEQPFAIQKGVTVVSDPTPGVGGDVLPGQQLDYSLNFQVSDYFQFQNLYVVDRLGDGQTFFADFGAGDFNTRSAIGLNWYEEGVNYTDGGLITGDATDFVANYGGVTGLYQVNYKNGAGEVLFSAYFYDANSGAVSQGFTDATAGNLNILGGETIVVFNLSALMIEVGGDAALIGGLVGNLSVGQSTYAGTQGTLTYRAKVTENFVNPSLRGGDLSVDIDDSLTNNVNLHGTVITWEPGDKNTGLGGNLVNDDSGTTLTVPPAAIDKEIYALNGTSFTGAASIAAGESITYAVTLTLPTADIENLKVTDFVPLPRFDAQELTSLTVQMQSVAGATPAAPAPGTVLLVLADDIYKALFWTDTNSDGVPDTFDPVALANFEATALDSTSQTNVDANSFSINLGSFDVIDSPANLQIKTYFTLTASDVPMADGLLLTNQVAATYNNTSTNNLVGQDIVQVIIEEPKLELYKGVVSNSAGAGLTIGGVTFGTPGTASGVTAGSVSTTAIATAIDSQDLSGVDAGDTVKFALVVENTGRADAYDVKITDTIPDNFGTPTNFVVQFGNGGTPLVEGTDYTVSITGNNFTITLNDNSVNNVLGSVGAGKDSSGVAITTGANYLVITYDVTLLATAQSNSTLTNQAAITEYSGMDGGMLADPDNNRVVTPVTVDAVVTTTVPTLTKVLVGTSVTDTGNNATTQAVVGELVTYTVQITVPEGTTADAHLLDTLDPGLAFVEIVAVTYDGVTSGTTITTGANPAGVTVGTGGASLNFAFGDISNAAGGGSTITITYTAVVLNTNNVPASPGNQAGTLLNNSATFTYTHADQLGDLTGGVAASPTVTQSVATTNVQVVEPVLTISMTASATQGGTYNDTLNNVDYNDDVFYKIIITNAAGRPTAWDLDISALLPNASFFSGGLSVVSATGTGVTISGDGNGLLGIEDFSITGSTLGLSGAWNVDLATGSIEIIVKGTALVVGVNPGQSLVTPASVNPSASVTWTSLNDQAGVQHSTHNAASTERTGAGGMGTDASVLNNYAALDATAVTIKIPANSKSIVATSEGSTSGTSVAVGEIVRYRLVVQLPEGTSPDLQIVDLLPAGLMFLNDGTAAYGFVAASNTTLSSSVLGTSDYLASLAATPTSGFADDEISTSSSLNQDVYGNGTDVRFKFGTVVNNDTANGTAEYIVIEFNALVLNVSGNQSGTVLGNSFNTQINGTTAVGTNATTVNVTVVEPNVDVAKATSLATGDAGDQYYYTITISNTSGVDAFNVSLQDVLNQYFNFYDRDGDTDIDVADVVQIISGPGSVTTANFTLNSFTNDAAKTLTTSGSGFTLLNGETLVIRVHGALSNSIPTTLTISNTASIAWTSLPDSGTVMNPTGSVVPVDLDPNTGERDGSGGVNDYVDSSSVTTTAINAITIDKVITNTSLGGNDGVATIGEEVTYQITITLPEGVVPDLQILDAIPQGMAYVNGSFSINYSALAGGVVTGSINPATGAQYLSGTDLRFDFDSITVTGDNDPSNNSFVITYRLVVLDVATNEGLGAVIGTDTTHLVNTATHNNGNGSTFGGADSASIDVVEPDLNVVNSLNITGPNDAGAPFTYTITVSPTATATSGAYEVNLADLLPAEFGSLTLASAVISDGATNTNVAGSFLLSGNSLSTTGSVTLLLNTNGTNDQVLTITITGFLTASVNPGETVNTTTSLAYTNYPGDQTAAGGFNPNPDVTTDHERSYTDSDTESFSAPLASFSKSLVDTSEAFTTSSNVAIGETVTYALLVTLPEGTTPDLSILDRLPAGLQYVSSSVVTTVAGSYGLLAADFNGTLPVPVVAGGATDGADIGFTFGSISVTGDNNADTNSFVILVTARVLNTVDNQGGDVLNNDATFDISGDSQAVFTTAVVPVTVVEPLVQVTQSVTSSTTGLDAGDTVTYSVTINNLASNGATTNAYDVSLSDVLPAGMLITGINAPVLSGGAVVDTALDGTGTNTLTGIFDIPLNGSVTFTFTAQIPNTVTPGQTLNADINVHYTSLDGTNANERDGSGIGNPENNTAQSTDTPVNNYAAGVDTAVSVVNPFAVTKSVINTSQGNDTSLNVVIGEVVTYQIAVSVMEGTTNGISIVDTLPAGLTYVPGTVVISNANGMTIGSLNVSLSGQTLTISTASVMNPGNSDNAAVADTDVFYITYQTVVSNVAGNQSGTLLTNDADASATGVSPDNNNSVTITVVEPVLVVDKTINGVESATGLTAGDAVVYTIGISHAGTSNSGAYDLIFDDAIPAEIVAAVVNGGADTALTMANITVTHSVLGDVSSSFELVGNTLRTIAGANVDLLLGQSLTITVTGVMTDQVVPGQIVNNSASVSWSSLDDSNSTPSSGERYGGGTSLNDYSHTDGAGLTSAIYTPNPTKAMVSTSEAATLLADVAIGERVTYSLTVNLYDGTLNNFVIGDFLPDGMRFLDTGNIVIAYTGSTSGGIAAGTYVWTGADTFVSSDLANTADTYASGSDIYFHLGDLTSIGASSVTITFTALVLDLPANVDGAELDNSFKVYYDTDGNPAVTTPPVEVATSNTVTIDVVEPELGIVKTFTPSANGSVDAGDTLTVNLAVTNTGSAAAWDISIQDLINNAYFDRASVATITTPAGWSSSYNPSTGELTFTSDGSTALAAGASINISFTVALNNTLAPGTEIDNTATITAYDSLQGNSPDQRTYDPVSDDAQITADSELVLDKSTVTTTLGGDDELVTIGETITYRLDVTLQQGVTQAVRLTDDLPAGFQYVGTTAIFRGAAGVSAVGGVSGITYTNGSLINAADMSVSGVGGILVFNFASVTIPATGSVGTGNFQVEYNTIVTNAAGNQAESSPDRTNSATVSADLNGDGDNADAGETTAPDTTTVTIVEPRVEIDKAITSSGPYTAGDSITYQITLTNPGNSTAYNVALSDVIPAGLLGTGTITVNLNGTATTITPAAFTGGGTGLSGLFQIANGAGNSVVITYSAQLQPGVVPDQSFVNDASATFTSMPDGSGRTGSGVLDPTDNSAPLDNDGTPLNNYAVGDSVTASAAGYAPKVSKAIVATSEVETTFTTSTGTVLVGEVVTYTLTVDLYSGTLNDLTIFDNLPAGMVFLANNNVVIAYAGSVTGGVVAGTYTGNGASFIADSLTGSGDAYGSGSGIYFQLGDLVSSGATSVTITFDALVMNVGGNVDGTALNNSFQVFYDADTNPATDPTQVTSLWVDSNGDNVRDAGEINQTQSNVVTLDVVEPDLTTPVKALISPAGGIVDAGDTVTYSLAITNNGTAIAHEVVVTDILDDDLTFGAVGSISVTGGGTAPTVVRDGNVFRISDIEVGQTVTFQFTATVNATVSTSELIANSATLTSYSSLPGENGTADATPGDPGDNDGERVYEPDLDSNTVSVTVPGPTIDKVNPLLTDYAIGEIVTWTITVTLPEGVTEDLVITDLIPSGLAFTGYTIPVGTANGITLAPSLSSGGTLGANGANVVLNFGDVTVPVGAAANTFQIQISAVVLNVVGNQAGVTFDNNASLTYTDPDGVTNNGTPSTNVAVADSDPSNDGPLTIIEPVLTVDKQINGAPTVTGLNGGDAVTYTITITNVAGANGADAHNVTLADLIPDAIGNLSFSAALNPAGANTDVTSYFTRTGQNLTTAGTGFTLAEGDVVVITVNGNVLAGQIVPGQVVTNDVDLDWSSVAGSVTDASTYLADGTDTERTGTGGVNDYADSADAGLTSEDYAPLVNKQIIATSEASTTGTNVTIGEVVTYQLKVELYEGTLNNFIIGDVLPPGLQFLAGSNVTIAYTGNITGGLAAGTYTSANAAISSSLTADLDVYASGSDVYFKLGNLTNSDNDLDLEFVTITFQAVVRDVAGNTATPATTLGNSFQVYYDADSNPSTDPSVVTTLRVDTDNDGTPEATGQSVSNTVMTTVVEPSLDITKANLSDGDGVIAPGQTVQYTVKVENAAGAAGATAYDVIIRDTMPAGALSALNLLSVELYTSAGVLVDTLDVSLGEYTLVSTGTTGWTITVPELAQDQYILVTYNATFSTTLAANTIIDNNARVFWDSLPADDGNANFGQTDVTEDRDYGDSSLVGDEAFNATTTPRQDTERVTVGGGSIGNRVWYDLDADGVQDADEVSLAGVTITLTGTNPTLGTTYTLTTTTDANGAYLFTGLAPDTYTIEVTLPPGGIITDVMDNGTLTPSTSTNVTITASEAHTDVDFGIRGAGSIGDLVWNNLDGDLIRDLGEPGIDGVRLNLIWDVNGNGVYDAGVDTIINSITTTTVGGVAGSYRFDNLLGGAYGNYLVQIDPTNFGPGQVFDNGSTVSYEKDDKPAVGFNGTSSVTLGVNEVDLAVDFGVTGPTGSVGDRVWYDINGNGVQESNEPGIAGVIVYIDQNGNGKRDAFEAFAKTDANGNYLIRGLVDGNYTIRVVTSTLPAGAIQTFDDDGLSTRNASEFDIVASGNRRDQDFGYRGSATLGDRIWHDADGDGIQDGGEEGISGITVKLYWDANGNGILDGKEGVTPLLTTTTDGNGNYRFGNLLNTGYLLVVDPVNLPAKFTATFDLDGIGSQHSAGASLAGGSRTDADFGYYDPTPVPTTSSFQMPPGLFGISYNTLSTYFMTEYDPRFNWQLPEWELVDSVPIFSSPMLSGHAEPGSKVVLSLYNHRGELVSTSTVLVGSGGNWTVGFAGVEVNGPITIESAVTAGDFAAFNGDDNFNYRTNYISGMAGGYFQSRLLGIDDAFSALSYERMAAMEANEGDAEEIEGWKKNNYEFLSAPALPGQ